MMRRNLSRLASPIESTRGINRPDLNKEFVVGSKLHGFTCTRVHPVPELNICGFAFTHDSSGAEYFHIDTDDQNNAFNVCFRTPALNDKGTTHVLEHTALCGSKKFPVRDPFFHMLRRSLNTFMNAMTGPDYTMYPFSTTNQKDYSNLLDVYLDATMNPLLRPEDFLQEGHRVELASEGEDGKSGTFFLKKASVNGVVYNEMKGVVSQPGNFFYHELWKHTHPETHYVYNSGGIPQDILSLTHKELVDFHSEHYHPSNAVVMTYGDLHPGSHMEKINAYFTPRGKSEIKEIPTIPPTARYASPKAVEVEGPPDLLGDLERQKRVGVSYVLPDGLDTTPASFARYSVLSEMLQGGANSPLYKKLIGSQLGTRYCPMSGYGSFMANPALTFGVEGVDETKESGLVSAEAIEQVITKTLSEAVDEGFDQRRVDSVVFQEELSQRHRSTQFGINLVTSYGAMRCTRGLDPFNMLSEVVPTLKQVQAQPKQLQDLLKQSIDHNHRVTLSVKPSATYLENSKLEAEAHETKLNAEMTTEKQALIEDQLAQWTAHKEAPQDASVLPSLEVADVSKTAFKEPEHKMINEKVAVIPHGTNGLVYVHGTIPFVSDGGSQLRAALSKPINEIDSVLLGTIQDASLFNGFLSGCGTEQFDFEAMEIENDLCHSGFGFGLSTNITRSSLTDFRMGIEFSFYTTPDKLDRALDLVAQSISEPILKPRNDKEKARFLSKIKGRAARKVAGVQHSGHAYAMTAACSTLSLSGKLNEIAGGMTSVRHLVKQQEEFSKTDSNAVDASLQSLLERYASYQSGVKARAASSAFTWATCEGADQDRVGASLDRFHSTLRQAAAADDTCSSPSWKIQLNDSKLVLPKLGVSDSSVTKSSILREKVKMETNFAAHAFPTGLRTCDRDQSVMRLACQALKNGFLHREVREEGGAYGVMISAALNGDMGGVTFGSYRDPTPERSLETFNKCADWIGKKENVTEAVLKEAKLSLFSKLDAPTCPSSFGQQWFCLESSHEAIQKSREELLSTTVQDIIEIAPKYLTNGLSAESSQSAILQPVE